MLVFVESIPLQNWYHSSIKKGLLEKLWYSILSFICMYIHVYTCVKEAGEGKDKCIAHKCFMASPRDAPQHQHAARQTMHKDAVQPL